MDTDFSMNYTNVAIKPTGHASKKEKSVLRNICI